MEQQYFTQERLEELKKELENLKTTRRAEVAERLKRAKELGDLSENVEYQEARDEQVQVETRIVELELMIKSAVIIQQGNGSKVVRVGSVLDIERAGQRFSYTIVGPNEADPMAGKISNESPLGQAFIGKSAGDTVKVKAPSGESVYKILTVK